MTDRPHLVIVDDEPRNTYAAEASTGEARFSHNSSAEGKEMPGVMERSRVESVVLDLMLPGEDGLSICRELRTRSQVPSSC